MMSDCAEDKLITGFIAQEVSEVIPNSVSKSGNYISDMMIRCQVDTQIKNSKTIIIKVANAEEFDRIISVEIKKIKLYINNCVYHGIITSYTNNLKVHVHLNADYVEGIKPADEVLIVGRYVEDFHMLDYAPIISYLVASVKYLLQKSI